MVRMAIGASIFNTGSFELLPGWHLMILQFVEVFVSVVRSPGP